MPKKKTVVKQAAPPKKSVVPVKTETKEAAVPSRKEPYTSDRLRAIVQRLREQSMRLSGLARAMDDTEVESIVVDGHAMLLRGLNQTDNFADNCARAVREMKTG